MRQPGFDEREQLRFVIDGRADLQPVDLERGYQFIAARAKIDGVLFRSQRGFGSRACKLSGEPAQLAWPVGVMIVEFDAVLERNTQQVERAPE